MFLNETSKTIKSTRFKLCSELKKRRKSQNFVMSGKVELLHNTYLSSNRNISSKFELNLLAFKNQIDSVQFVQLGILM